jgi:UDP-N-acetylmuramate: L-alanyl-gamma-D-glutamyl-meso-diaminopimelate ligase
MQIKDLKPGAHIHLMGICGTAMASLAGLLKDRGFHVSGSEMTPYPPMSTQIEELGIKIQKPYSASNLNPRPDFVIVGNVISANNEEAQELVRLKIPYTSLPQAMGDVIIADKKSIVIAGTHGKTTTTSMMAYVASELGLKPGFLIGGIAKNFSRSFQNPQGDYFIIEGDEYDTAYFDKVPKFLHYKPDQVILTSVEFDHADIYADLAAVKASFKKLMEIIPENGTLVYCKEDSNVEEISVFCKAKKKFSYGLSRGDYRAQILKVGENGTQFRVHFQGNLVGDFETVLSGEYNILNCTAVIAICHINQWSADKTAKAMKSFLGVKRRQEILGEPGGVLLIEDFAHHPTAVRETLKGIREKYKSKKIFAVFEPRSATSRRKIFQKEYAQAFAPADETLLMQAFDQSKIAQADRFSSDELAKDIAKLGKHADCYSSVDQIVDVLKTKARSGDLILLMSNGGFDGIYGKLIKAIESRGDSVDNPKA